MSIPEEALKRACDLLNAESGDGAWRVDAARAFAKYIAEVDAAAKSLVRIEPAVIGTVIIRGALTKFLLPDSADPLTEVVEACLSSEPHTRDAIARNLRAELSKRGLKIVGEKE